MPFQCHIHLSCYVFIFLNDFNLGNQFSTGFFQGLGLRYSVYIYHIYTSLVSCFSSSLSVAWPYMHNLRLTLLLHWQSLLLIAIDITSGYSQFPLVYIYSDIFYCHTYYLLLYVCCIIDLEVRIFNLLYSCRNFMSGMESYFCLWTGNT